MKELDELIPILNARKDSIKRFLLKNFGTEHYEICIIKSNGPTRNKERILVKEDVFNIIKETFNLKHKYVKKTTHFQLTHPILMRIESASIGFIYNSLYSIIDIKTQYKIGSYFVDLYLPTLNLVIECDEDGHRFYNKNSEMERESFIKKLLNCNFLRFNPQEKNFDLSLVFRYILKRWSLKTQQTKVLPFYETCI